MAMHATHAVALCPTGGAHSSKTTGLKVITETIQSFSDKWYSVASVEPKGGWIILWQLFSPQLMSWGRLVARNVQLEWVIG